MKNKVGKDRKLLKRRSKEGKKKEILLKKRERIKRNKIS